MIGGTEGCSRSTKRYLLRRKKKKEKRKAEKLRKRVSSLRKALQSVQEGNFVSRRVLKQLTRDKLRRGLEQGVIICFDCSYESLMSPKECGKFAQQFCRAYGANRSSATPASLHLVSCSPGGPLLNACKAKCDGFERYTIVMHNTSALEAFGGEKEIVYLSPDAEQPLLSVDKSVVYVVGCLVDEHLLKGKSLAEATRHGCKALRLPLQEYAATRHMQVVNPVLAINQVVEVLLGYIQMANNWEEVIHSAVPSRLFRAKS